MKTIYIDSDFKCHITNDGTMTAVETDLFDGKCDSFIEGYRFVPAGENWTRSDGAVFHGEMISPWKDCVSLVQTQKEYEKEMRIAALEAENAALKEENELQAAQVSALSEQMDFYEECIVEMAEVVYA